MVQPVSVRELGGEVYAELHNEMLRRSRKGETEGLVTLEALNHVVDVMMSIIARHVDKKIVNDRDLPVDPLPVKTE